MVDIGSIFSLNSVDVNYIQSTENQRRQFFALCREALLQIIKDMHESKHIVLLPAFTCASVVYPFEQEGWTVVYYPITISLQIDANNFISLFRKNTPSLVLFHPYFGSDLDNSEVSLVEYTKQQGATVVIDITQCYYSQQRLKYADYYIGSLYKWFPLVDGGFMETSIPHEEPKDEFSTFVSLQKEAMYLRAKALKTDDEYLKTISRRINYEAVKIYNGPVILHKMSAFSTAIFSNIVQEDARNSRWKNATYLLNELKGCRIVSFPINERIKSAPLYLPILCNDRESMQKYLASQHIYAPALWNLYNKKMLVTDDVRYLYNHLLAIPIDQRYEKIDMHRIVEAIYTYESTQPK